MAGGLRAVAADGRPEGPRRSRRSAPALVKAFDDAKDDDPRVRRYLALAIGRLDPPLPPEAVDVLTKSLTIRDAWTPDWSRINGWTDDMNEARISTIWALGSSGDAAVVADARSRSTSRADAGIRKMVVYALGALPGDAQIADAARRRCRMRRPTCAGMRRSRWRGTATRDGVPVLRQMLDRAYVEQTVTRDVRQDDDHDPVADVMISGLRAAAALKDASAAGRRSKAEPAGSQHEGAAGGARSAEGDGIAGELSIGSVTSMARRADTEPG